MDILLSWSLSIILLITAIEDLIYKKISTWIIGLGMIILCIILPFSSGFSLMESFLGALVGIGVMLLSKATKGKIGMGDGLILIMSGLALGLWKNLEVFLYALFIAALASVLLLIFKVVNKKSSIPFVPFIFLGHVLVIFINK